MKYKVFTIIITCLALVCSCKTIQYVPIKGDTQVEYRDTTIYKDSIIYTPVEVVKEVVPQFDTLSMSTSLAEAKAYVDTTTKTLKGSIKNKKGVTEKVKYKEKVVYRDSIRTQEIPVEVPVEIVKTKAPFYQPILWFFALLSIGYIAFKLIKRYLIKV